MQSVVFLWQIMHKSTFFALIFTFIPLFVGCNIDPTTLYGKWQAYAFYENGQTVLRVPLDEVQLSLHENGRYEFNTMGFYHEAGFWKTSMKYLFLTDTTETTPKERTLKILLSSPDSIKIEMKKGDNQQVVFFRR